MKLYKKYLSFLLTIVLSLSLVSCNSETPAKAQAKFDNFLEDYIRVLLSKYITDKESFSKYALSRNKEG